MEQKNEAESDYGTINQSTMTVPEIVEVIERLAASLDCSADDVLSQIQNCLNTNRSIRRISKAIALPYPTEPSSISAKNGDESQGVILSISERFHSTDIIGMIECATTADAFDGPSLRFDSSDDDSSENGSLSDYSGTDAWRDSTYASTTSWSKKRGRPPTKTKQNTEASFKVASMNHLGFEAIQRYLANKPTLPGMCKVTLEMSNSSLECEPSYYTHDFPLIGI